MNGFHFMHPWWLSGLLVCLALAWLLRAPRSAWQRIMTAPFHALITGKRLQRLSPVPWLLALGVLALAGPSWQKALPGGVTPQSNVMVILQQDLSMLAQDLPPDRHQRMQHKIAQLMQQMPGSHFGLVVYRGGAWLTTPLTSDPAFYSLFLQAQQPTLLPDGQGNGLAAALRLADDNLPDTPRSIVLVADTLRQEDARLLGQTSLPLQLWVPGTAPGGPLPPACASQAIDTRLNVARFQQLRANGVAVTLATPDDSDLPAIRRHIQQSLSAQQNSRADLPWHNSGYWLIAPMLLLLLWWRRQILIVLIVLPLGGITPPAAAALLDAFIPPDLQGQHAFQRQDYARAAQHYVDPLRRGIALYYAGDFSAASGAFRQAPVTPESLLWLGNSLAQQKQWQQALQHYDQALSLRPDWRMAQQNRASIARIVMQLRQQERDRQAAQGKEQDYDPDGSKKDLHKQQGVAQQVMQPAGHAAPQVSQWYDNLSLSPGGLLENLYRQESP
ncbi:VWA domain-containing protein [Pantoea dispersa]|uniref:VWA domain-containing protein n=1 Tax=Pantoea dispersa TaxID=59814 RepID=UPI0012389449|nr:VWA domain-containing protein [Pantoea dispersa]KAA8673405.1 VWA domain-containing protein [Pantoea dispersa]